ncbi:MAG: glutaredoxin family protein [Candidatus Aenigmatarchaeota archaeon]
MDCLDEGGVTVYGTHTCPACTQLAESLGGFELTSQIFVECTEEQQRCRSEMRGTSVPEIHINGQHYNTGVVSPDEIADEVNCELPQ